MHTYTQHAYNMPHLPDAPTRLRSAGKTHI